MQNKTIIKKIFKDYIKNTWKYKFIFTIFLWFFVAFITVIEPVVFIQLIKKVEIFLTTWDFNKKEFFNYLIFRWFFIIFSNLNFIFYRYHFISKTCIKNYTNITLKYMKNIINMNYDTYLSKEVWKIYKIFDRWVEYTFNFIFFFFLEFIKSWWWILIIIWILFWNNIQMAFVTLALFPVMIIVWIMFYKKLFPMQQALDRRWEKIYSDLWNSMSVFSLVKTLSLENRFIKKFNNTLDDCYSKQIKIDKGWSVFDIYISFFVMASRFLVLWFWVYFVFNWQINFATLFLFFSYIGRLYFPLWSLFSRLRNIQQYLTAIWTFYKEFEHLESEYKNNKWKKIKDIKWKIEFKDVNFWYWKKEVLKDISFNLKSWEKIAFVGNTWAWKSTIVNLILRFWEIKKWEIKLDWVNIKNINLKSLRKNIWVVSQDNSLFNLSIRENLMFANSKATKNDLKDVLNKAEANFVFDLEKWLDSVIWERGLKLSWWEKQRLSIARLFLKNPKILILDEATSALDNKTEKLIQKALDNLMKWRTSIIIAHRLSTIKHVDRIFVLKHWRIVEAGSYKELVKMWWEFAKLTNVDSLVI